MGRTALGILSGVLAVALTATTFCAQAQQPVISFTDSDNRIWGGEGEAARAAFSLDPAPTMPVTVRYTFDHDTADAADYEAGSGEVVVPADATGGTIEIPIVDDDDIEPLRERFYVNLVDSAGYTLGNQTRLEVLIAEGVCDRTPQIRDRLSRGRSSCRDVNISTINGIDELTFSARGIDELKEKDFLQLGSLERLYLQDNGLTSLPEGVFAGLGDLEILTLHGNELTTLPAGVFAGLGDLEILTLNGNELTTLPEGVFAELGSLGLLTLYGNQLTTLPPGAFLGLSSLRSLRLHDNPGTTFSLTLRLEPADEAANVNLARLANLLSTSEPATVKLTLHEGAPYPLTLALTATGVELSADQVTMPAGSTRSVAFTATRNMDRVRIALSEPPRPPDGCPTGGDWSHEGPCFSGFEIAGAPTINFVYDGMGPRVTTIRFTSTPQDPGGYAEGEVIRVDVVFDRGLVISPIMEGSSSPTLALQVGADRRTAAYVVGSNVGVGILSFVYTVRAGDLDGNGVSVARDGLQLNGASVTEPVGDLDANVNVDDFLADFPEQQVRARTALSISFEESEIEPAEGETVNAVFNFSGAVAMPTIVRYSLMPGTADANDYVAGSGEVIVPAGMSSGTIRIPIVDDAFIERPRDTFSLSLDPSGDYALGSPTRIEVSIREGVCDRTPQVRDEIVDVIGSVSNCTDVTDDHLSGVTGNFVLSFSNISILKADDFSGFGSLRFLALSGNRLSTLPTGVFSDLGNLQNLRFHNSQLSTLPTGVFSGLGNLERLTLYDNRLSTLPAGVFADLDALRTLTLHGNELTTLPPGAFVGLDSLELLTLYGNRLTTLPPGVFSGLSSLRSLRLNDNPGVPFRLTLGLEPADEAEDLASLFSANTPVMVKLTLREGAPYPLTLALTASGVELSADQVTIPAGSTQSETFTATRNMDRVRIALSEPPRPPDGCPTGGDWSHEGPCFSGFEIVGAPTINFVYDGMGPQVTTIRFTSTPQDPGGYAEGEVIRVDVVFDRRLVIDPPITEGDSSPTLALQIGADRRTATYVVGSNAAAGILSFVYTVRAGDFDENGVSVAQDGLELNGASVTEPVGDLDANVNVDGFLADFPEQRVRTAPSISFEESEAEAAEGETVNAVFNFSAPVAMPTTVLYALTPGTANADDYEVGSGEVIVPAGESSGTIRIPIVDDAFIERTRETFSLSLDPSGDYELGSPTRIEISIKEGVCDRTPQVAEAIGQLRSRSDCSDVENIGSITQLFSIVRDRNLTALKGRDFFGLDSLVDLYLFNNGLTTLPAGVFDDIGTLRRLRLDNNRLTTLPEGVFDALGRLVELWLNNNGLTTLPGGAFDNLGSVLRLTLNNNQLTALPAGAFTGLSSLRVLRLHDNPGTTFSLTLRLEPADEAANVNRVKLTLREGAPYPLEFDLTASGVQLSANQVTIPAGSTQSETFTMTPSMDGNPVRITLSDPPLPNNCVEGWKYQGQCFTGFEIVHDRTGPRATTIRFASAPQRPEGYVAGEVIRVDVVFDKGLVIDPPIMDGSPSSPTLELQIGADRRTATYVAENNALAGILSFVYTVRAEDFDDNGVSVARNGLQLNGSTITDVFSNPANLANLGVDDFLADFPEQKARTFLTISFERTSIETLEGETINAVFNFYPAVATPTTTVRYSIIDETTSSGDYTASSGSGEVVVPEGETSGTIRITIVDDDIIERTRDRFDLRLDASNDFTYSLGSQTRIEVTIKEGVCDRTSSVRAFFTQEDAQASHCSDVSQVSVPSPPRLLLARWNSVTTYKRDDFTDENLNKLPLSALELSRHAQLATLPAGLFGDLLEELRLNNNGLNQLPADLFAGLTNLQLLRLDGNSLTTLPEEPSPPPGDFVRLFTGLTNLQQLRLDGNELATLSENQPFTDLGSLQQLYLYGNRLNTLPEDVFWGLSSLSSLQLHDNPGAPFRLTSGLEAFDKTQELAKLLEGTGAVMVELKLREGAPYPLEFDLTASGVQLSPNSVTIPAGSTRSETITATRDTGQNRVRIDFSAPPPPPNNCMSSWRHRGQCFTGFEIVGAPTIDFVYDGMGPQVAAIRFTSTPQDPDGYVKGEIIRVDVVFDRGLVIDPPITEGASSSPTLALQIGADRRTATYVAGSNVGAGILSFVYAVKLGDLDENGVSVVQDGLELNGAALTEPVNDNPANLSVDDFLADFPGQKVRALPIISFEESEIEPAEGETINAVFNFNAAVVKLTTVRYSLTPGTADANDYVAGSGEVVVSIGANSGTIRIPIVDDNIVERARETFSLNLDPSDGYVLGSSTRIEISIREGVCDRTPQVRDKILELISGVSNCADVTDDHLSEVTGVLDLSSTDIDTISADDFSGLDGLNGLDLSSNRLTTLSSGAFIGLGNLENLRLSGNRLEDLPERVFSILGSLETLDLSSNRLTTLPPDVFSDLGSLEVLYLGNNRLAGVSLPSTIFSALANLETLDLSNNRLDDLPPDVFSDLGNLETLYLGNNRLAEGSLSGTTFSAFANLETLDLSNNQLVASSLPTDVFSALVNLERLDLSSNQLSSLPANVFSGLVELEAVWLSSNVLTTLPDDVFSGLRNLRSLYLNQNQLASLPPDVFSGLAKLEELWLNANELSALPATVFSGLDNLRWLFLDQNELGALPASVFSGLDNLRWLFLSHNQLSTLPPTVFSGPDDSGLPNLERLYLGGNQLSALTGTVFSSLGSLRELSLRSNRLSALPATVFSGLDRLGVLWLSSNVLTALPDDVFSGLSGLQQLYLFGNQLSALPDGVFSGLDNLRWLDLHGNGLSALPANTFSGLLNLNVLNLAGNPGAPFVLARSRLVYVGRTDPPMPRTGTFKLVLDRVAPVMTTVNLSVEGGELSGGLSGGETVISAGNTESDPFTVTQDPGASLVTLRASTGALTGYYSGVETAASELVVDLIGPSVSGVTIISRPSFGDAYQASLGEEIRVAITFDQAVSVSNAPTLTLTIGETTRAATYDPSLTEAATLVFTYVLQAGDVDEDGISVESDALMLDGATITLMSAPLTPLQITSLGSYEILNAAGHRVIPNSGLSFDASAGLILEIEEGGTIDLTVTLSSPTNVPVAVGYEITADADPGTADADASDYSVPSPGSVTIEAGETTAVLSVPINDDAEAEPARESFVVSLMPVAGYDPVFPATVLVVIKEGVCDRTPQIENSILERIGNLGDLGNCADASDDDLSEIRTLTSTGITTAISLGDFSGLDNLETLWLRSGESLVLQDDVFSELVNLRRLDLHQSRLTALPAGVFSGLGSLEELWLSSNRLTVLPPDVFSGLANLRRLFLGHNGLTALPPTVFSGLPNLERLHLDSNQLSTLPNDVFSSLGNLRELSLGSNLLSTLSAPMFSGLGNLEALYLWGNQLASLPDRVFESLGNLEKLELSNNRLGTLPGNVFLGLGNLKSLYLSGNELSSLSGFTFFPLTNLERLYLFDNQLTSIQGPVFSLLGNLQELNLNGNQLASLGGLEFSGLSNLQVLHLSGNQLVTLPANIFSPVTGLQELHLIGNQLTTLPEGIFSGLVSNLRKLRLHDNPGAPFVVARPRLEPTGTSPGPGVVEVELVVDETLPTTMTAALSMDGGTLSVTEAVIPGGSTESATFTVTQATAAPATLTASAGTLAGRLHYTGVVTAPSELVLDSIVPSISFEESEIEAAEGETINAVFNFNVAVGMQTIVRYTLEHGTADANDYMVGNGAGSGEVVVPEGATEGTIEIPIVDDADIEPVRELFYVNLVDSAGYTPGNRTRLEVSIAEGACDRTRQIRDRLSRGLGSCRDVDIDTLNRLDGLTLSARGIDRLKEKDFLQLMMIEKLFLRDNQLTTLPERVFAGFSALEILTLHGNELTTLPPGVFADLGSLEILTLYGNQLTMLPPGVFSGLSSLKALQLHDNPGTPFRLTLGLEAVDEAPDVNLTRLASLLSANTPVTVKLTLREGAPYPLTLALTASGVQLSADSVTIPAGGTQSETFAMTRNTGANRVRVDFSAPPSPPNDCPEEEKRQGQCFTGFEIVGAPPIDLALDPSISFEESEIEAAEGATINAVFNIQPPVAMQTIVRYRLTPGTADVNDYVDVAGNGEVVVPADATSGTIRISIVDDELIERARDTFSLNLVDSDNYALGSPSRIEISIREGVCDRTPQVQDAILGKLSSVDDCADVTDGNLSGIQGDLPLNDKSITNLKEKDFSGLTSLEELRLQDNDLRGSLPANLFAGLQALRGLQFQNNQVSTWPASIFNGLSNLQTIDFGSNEIMQLPDDIFADNGNLQNLLLGGNRLLELSEQVFFGLPQLRNLSINGNRLTELPAGAFPGYRFLNRLRLSDNQLESLPPGLFSDLESANWVTFHNNRLTALPPGAFSGPLSKLGALSLGGNPGAPFRLKLRLEFADEEQAPTLTAEDVVLRATLREGAPYALAIELQARRGTLSATEVAIKAGSTRSGTFTVARLEGESSVAVSFADVSPPTPPNTCPGWQQHGGQCFSGLEIVSDAEFVLDDQPLSAVSGVAITSAPISGNSYMADNPDDEIVVELGFSGEIDVVRANDGSWPSLALEVGDETRFAVYDDAESSPDRLVFRYKPQAADADGDGISVPDGALRLNGARILDAGVPVPLSSLSLGSHAIRNAPNHNVNVQVGRDLRLSFDPAEVALRAGGSPEVVALTLEGNELLEPGETVVVTLTPSQGLEVRSESGENLTMVTLGRGAGATARVRVSANRDADHATPGAERLSAAASALPANVRVAEATLRVMVEQREIRVLFEPGRILMVRGGAAADMVSTAVTMRTEPELQSGEALVISLSADGVTLVSPTGAVTLTPANNAVPVTLAATRPLSALGAVSATLDEGASSLGNARVTTESLMVEVVRGVELSLSDHAGQAVEMIVIVAGESTEITVATVPVLEEDERVTVTLSVDPRLSLENVGSASIDGNVLVLSAMNPSATVTVTADTPSLDLPSGLSASGAGENVGVVDATSLQVRTAAVDEVTLVLSPSPVIEVQQGTRTTLRVTTDPPLGMGQITMVSLTIEPADAGLSFVTGAGGASNSTVRMVRLGQDQPFLDVEVAAASDAAIGNTAQVTSTVSEVTQVEVDVDGRSRVTLEVTLPQVAFGFTPAGVLELDLSASGTVELGFSGFTLSGSQTAEFEVSVEGEGLTLAGGVQMTRVSFAAGESAKPISVTASADAASAGRLVVRAVGGVELAGGMETATLPIRVSQSVSLSFAPDVVLIPRSRSAQFEVAISPPLVADRQTTVTLAISGQGSQGSQGFAFGGGQTQHEIRFDADKSRETVTAEATAAPGSTVSVSVEVTVSSGVALAPPPSLPPSLSLQATVPRAALDLTPAGGAPGDELVLNTGTDKAVRLSLPDLTLSGDHVAEFEVSVEGEGLSLQGGTQVSLSARNMTAEVTVSAATDAASVGRLVVVAVGGVELAGGMETVALPIRVLQSVSLSFDPDSVLIQRGRSAQFEVAINPSLVADRQTTVTLVISDQGFVQGFAFGAGRTQHEIRFDADKSRETVTVATTAAIGSTVPVSVDATATPGVALGPLPSLSLQATIPQVAVVLSPADELRLTSGGEAPVGLRLDGYSLIEDQEIVLEVSVDDVELRVSPSRVTLTEAMQSATVRVSASPRAESGNLTVSALSGAELVGGPRSLPVTVSARELAVSFEPSMVRLVRGGAAAETASAEVSLSVAPGLEGDERLVLELTSGVAGNLIVTPSEATLSSMVRTVDVSVTATPGSVSTEVVALESPETSIGNAEVSFMPLTVEVVRGVELLLSDHAGQAVETVTIVAGESTEITVATSPLLVGDERVTVALSVAEGLTLEGTDSELIGGMLVLTSAAKSASTRVRVGTSTPDLDLGMGISASGAGENVVVVGASPSFGVVTEASGEVTVVLPSVQVAVQQGRSAMLRVGTNPLLGTEQAATLRLTIAPAEAGLSFAAGSSVTDVGLRGTQQSVDVEVTASADVAIGSEFEITSTVVDVSEGLEVFIAPGSEATLEVTTPRVVLGLRPAGGEIGEALTLNLGESKAVELSLTDFTLSGSQTAEFEVSVEGEGLTLSGDGTSTQVSLDAVNVTAGVAVSASDGAVSVGELSVRALSGVELAGGMETASLPIEALQEVSLRFDPDSVLIQRGRSTQFKVATTPSLVADRRTTVTLVISDQGFAQGFSFGDGSTRHEVALDAGKSSQTVTVAATAAIGSMVSVEVDVIPTSGVRALRPLPSLPPSLSLQATTPQVAVAFSPAAELRLLSGGEAPVELRLDGYSLIENQEIVLEVSVDEEELEVTPSRVTLTETMQSATVRVRASRRVESGNLMVSALSGAELVGGTQSLPVVVSPRELTVSFEPSMVRLVRGGAAAETTSTEVWLSVAPGLQGDERLVLELTSGVAGNLEVSPVVATLSSMVRAIPVRATASLTTVSTEVTTSVDDANIGNAEVSLMPLTVEVVRGVELLLLDHAGQAVEMIMIVAGESTDITVATSPTLVRGERVTVTLSVIADLTLEGVGSELIGGNVLVLTSSANSSARVRVSTSTPDLDLGIGISASGKGENVGVVGELPSLGVAIEVAGEVAVVLPSVPVEVPQGSSVTFRVETSPLLDAGQAATLRLTIEPADAGLSFAGGSSVTDVRLGETRQSVDVAVFASEDVIIGSEFEVASTVVNASVGLRVTIDDRSEATLEVTTPEVTVSPPSDGTRLRIRVFLEGALE